MVQITIFWNQKWVQSIFLMVFHVSLWFVSFKTPKYTWYIPISGNIQQNEANFSQKWVPRLNRDIWYFTFFKDSSHHPMVISLSEKKDIICMINPLRWDETKLGNKTLVKKDPSRKSYYAPVGASSVSGMPEFFTHPFF